MKILLTILDSIAETSMPFNEFVLYRANHFKEEKQVLIVCNKPRPLPQVTIPGNLEIAYIGSNPLNWRKKLRGILSKYKDEEYAIHLHQAGPSMKLLLVMLGTGFRGKVVFTVHSTFSGYKFYNKLRSYVSGLLARYVVCCSKTSFERYPYSLKRIKGERVTFIENGVDTERIDGILAGKVVKSHEKVVFAYVARMIPLKNHDFLIGVAKRTSPNTKYLLIGKEDKEIIQRISNEGLTDRIETTGLIPRNLVFERLRDADVYLSTSTLEGLPVSVLEGMFAGMPAILSDIPQHREVASDKEFVTLLPFDEDQWVNEINRYAGMSKEQLTSLGEKSRNYVEGHFSLVAMHNKYSIIYDLLR